MDITYGTPTGLYLIIEQLYSKSGMPTLANTIGPSIMQIYRMVLQVHELHDTFMDGKLVTTSTMNTWQMIKGSLGIDVVTKPNGQKSLKLEYAGFTNEGQPLPQLGNLVPEILTKKYLFKLPTPYLFGTEPLPAITLYRNPRVVFKQTDGGTSPATAVAKYNSANRELIMLETTAQIEQALRAIKTKNPLMTF